MPRALLFIVDPLDTLKPAKDSSIAMMREAARRNLDIWVAQPADLKWTAGRVIGHATQLHLTPVADLSNPSGSEAWFTPKGRSQRHLADFDAVLMRKDPPFDTEYLYVTHLLQAAAREGARVFNDPKALRDHNEKLAITEFHAFTSPTLVTSGPDVLREFHQQFGDIVVKPLDGMGGRSVFRLRQDDPNLNVILETITDFGARTVMAQRFIPEIKHGDKRILLIAGQAVPYALARIPRPGETRGNLAAGGTGRAQPLTSRDKEIAEALAPVLAARGLMLVGLDVIGDYLTEINVTSPTCFVEITQQTGFNVARMFIDALEAALR